MKNFLIGATTAAQKTTLDKKKAFEANTDIGTNVTACGGGGNNPRG